MRHRLVDWVPVLVAGALAATSCSSDSPTDTFELSGYVTDRRDGTPISGARVTFTSDTLYSESTRTDSDGLYEMLVESDQPFGQVRAEADGYVPAEQTVFFDSPIRRLDLTMRPQL